MRYLIAREGVVTGDGRLIPIGVLTWPPYVPVYRSIDVGVIVGFANQIRREDGGNISAALRFPSGSLPLLRGAYCGIEVRAATWEADEPVLTGGSIAHIVLTDAPAWHGLTPVGGA